MMGKSIAFGFAEAPTANRNDFLAFSPRGCVKKVYFIKVSNSGFLRSKVIDYGWFVDSSG
jgi:hypothetical protein